MCAGTRFGDPGGWLPRDSMEKSQKGPAAAEGVRRAGGRGAERAPGAVTCGCAAGRRRGAGPRRPARPRLGASPASGAFSGGEGDGSGAGSRCQRLGRAASVSHALCALGVSGARADAPPSLLPQFQILEGSPAPPMCPPSCRRRPWRTCCARTPLSPARTTPPPAVWPPPTCPSRLSSAPRSCTRPGAPTGSCPRS